MELRGEKGKSQKIDRSDHYAKQFALSVLLLLVAVTTTHSHQIVIKFG